MGGILRVPMAKVDTIQTSFAGGEFGPSLYGRTDIAQYANACAIVENFLIRPYGSAISAPGTNYVATVSDSTLRTRLIKFVFNRTDAYVIEMGDLYMRFFTNRGQVITPVATEDLSAYSANLKAQWKANDNTNSTTVLDGTGSHSGSVGTLTSSISTTGIINQAFDLKGLYHVSVADHADFTRTASSQPMTIMGWFYYKNNGATQALISKSNEYDLLINSSDQLVYNAYSANSNTKLLLHMNGTDGSTTFTDSSASANAVTAIGNAQIDTAQSKFGGASGLFDGSGDYLSMPDSADFAFGSGDFTIDLWVRFNTIQNTTFYAQSSSGAAWCSFYYQPAVNRLWFEEGGGTGISFFGTWTPSTNTWYHLALVRNGNNWNIYVNGTSIASTTNSGTMTNFTGSVYVGEDPTGNSAVHGSLDGWMDEVRVVKGAAGWTSNFTPPTTAYQGLAQNSWAVNEDITEGWNFIAVVFKGDGTSSSDVKVYVNGLNSDLTFTPDSGFVKIEDTSSLFRIGASSASGANNWKNKVDNIAFIHQELTAVQIAALYSTTPYQLTTVFTENEIADVHFTQLNDVIWLAHPNHPPQKLVRTSANEWTISNFAFIGGPFLDSNTNAAITITPSGTTGTINLTVSPTNSSLFTPSGSTLGHHQSYWMIADKAQTNATTGLQEVGYVQITNVVNSYTATATVIKNLKAATATSVWAEGAWSAVRGYPSQVIFHDSRLWFGRTDYEPQKIWGSKIFLYENYALDTQADDDALNLALVSNEANELQWLASTKNLISGTYGGGFVVSSGGDNLAITPDNARANEEIGIGSSSIQPKRIGSFLYYLQRFKKKLRELFYQWDNNTYKAVDRTILSPHILGKGAIDMDVQLSPDPMLYCVLTNGTLAILTRESDQEFAAWSRLTTNGTYSSVAVIPSQAADYDEAWVIVERWINGSQKKYIEYFENYEIPDRQEDCIYLHCALSYSAYQSTSTSNVTISLSASNGSITITSSTAYFASTDVNRRLRAIDSEGNVLGEATITATNSTTSIAASVTTTFNALRYSPGFWGKSVASVSGIDHLESETVGILADGIKESLTKTVAGGTISLSSNYFEVHVGLSYDQIIYTLPKESGAQRGTAQGKIQRISELAFKVNNSYTGFQYGPDANTLDTLSSVDTTLTQSLTTGVIGNIPFGGGYQRAAQIYIKNSDPLPLEIVSIIATLDTMEK